MRRSVGWVRWAMLFGLAGSLQGVSCAQAVFREAQFGVLDGVSAFAAGGVAAVLTSLVPFLSQA